MVLIHHGCAPELEALLLVGGALHPPERRRDEERKKLDDSDEEDSEDDDPSSRMRSAATATNGRTQKNIRGKAGKEGDSDSDFEFDL